MEGRKRGGGKAGGEGGAAPGTPEFFEEQYRAMEASLERALGERMAAAKGGAGGGAAAAAGGAEGGWRAWRPEIYFAITLVGLGLLWWRGGGGAAEPAAGAAEAAGGGWLPILLFAGLALAGAALLGWAVAYRRSARAAAPGAARRPAAGSRNPTPIVAGVAGAAVVVAALLFASWWLGWWGGREDAAAGSPPPAAAADADDSPAGAEPGADPAAEPDPVPADPEAAWEDLLAARRQAVAAWLAAAARRDGLAADQISDFQADAFADRAARLAAGDLAGNDAENIRRGLFEYVYALAEGEGAAAGLRRQARITLGFEGFEDPIVGDLLRRLDLDDSFAAPYRPLDPALQVAVLDRWLARRPPPADGGAAGR